MRPKLIALVVMSALALAGCSANEATDNVEDAVTPSALNMSEAEAAEPTQEVSLASSEDPEQDFLSFMEPSFSGWTGDLPAKDKLLAAGYLACEQLKQGKEIGKVEVIEGSVYNFSAEDMSELTAEERNALQFTPLYANNQRIANAAQSALCPETIK